MFLYYLSLGSNINPEDNLSVAIKKLRNTFQITKVSNFYLNSASGFEGRDFINGCIEIVMQEHDFDYINSILKATEDHFGRDRKQPKFSDRPLDIDIVLVIQEENLIYISKEIQDYDFVSIPLSEIITETISNKLEISRVSNSSFEEVKIYL
jgi:2-amino-4-hydroxy-6-hydroxymethyldihydropteridine diphosphokinase